MSDTQLIKDKVDVVDLIGEYVQLKPAGSSHKGLCPFHREKSPSFMVSRERQSWHCFGCGKGGDVFSFVQEIEGMEFVEALKLLATRAGVQLTNVREDTNKNQKNRLKEINDEAARFFHNFLLKIGAAEPARAYLKRRGVKDQTIVAWQIGFIADQWDLLTQYLLKKGFSIDDLVASGLTIKRDNADPVSKRGFYDRFRGRVMFPIWDVHGTVVGFTGRVLVETEYSGGKYVNTPQTLVYDKSRVVFGLDKAKQEIKHKDLVVMVEGQMDVIACHEAGMTNVVATSGTALTDEQVQLLKRYSNNVAIAFDADAAGQAAAKRGIDIALAAGMNIRIIQIPEGAGKDPDECIKKNPAVWFAAVEQARDIMEWYFARAFAGVDVANPKNKQHIAESLLPEITRIPYAVEQDFWFRELSSRLGVDVTVLKEDTKRLKIAQKPTPKANSTFSAGQAVPEPVAPPPTRLGLLTERLTSLLVKYPKLLTGDAYARVAAPALEHSPQAPIYELLKVRYTAGELLPTILHDVIRSCIGEQGLSFLLMKAELDFSDFGEKEAQEEFEKLMVAIVDEWKKDRRKELQRQLEEVERSGDSAKLQSILDEFKKI
jgi:DNA primase